MDANTLFGSLDLVAGSGYTLNSEERAALQTSLRILKKDHKFNRVLFWGKILGLDADYFIAQGRGEDEMKNRTSFYSLNCTDWFQLPLATDSVITMVTKAAKGRFMGDPSFVYKHDDPQKQGAEDEEETADIVTEEMRLAVTVHAIDKDVSVVPRGAFVKRHHGLVQLNRSFGGLSESEAKKLDSYLHFSEPKNLKKKSILELAELNPAIDFLDVVSDDVPKGSWSLQVECAGTVCVLRSLLWLGLTNYCVPMTQQHGYIYIGDGIKNLNLPFMI
uniref:Radial spoke head protein 9 homolog n=1 Tax=Gouania willdenowi TaxID=441366 RepID=A0A8C5HUU7_GOUWI